MDFASVTRESLDAAIGVGAGIGDVAIGIVGTIVYAAVAVDRATGL